MPYEDELFAKTLIAFNVNIHTKRFKNFNRLSLDV